MCKAFNRISVIEFLSVLWAADKLRAIILLRHLQ
jgi:hypothetical protein